MVQPSQMNRNSFGNTVLTVSQVTNAIKDCLESQFPPLMVQGEISNLRLQSSGHCYFSLKDSQAQIGAVMFKAAVALCERLPKEGDQVTCLGQLNVYAPRGQYQLVIRSLRYSGLGELLLKLEEQKKLLQARGWFDAAHKIPLPSFPHRIGLVTSPTGAVLQDILNVLKRRHAGLHLILNPVRVQGKEAAPEIAQAIRQFNEHQLADVLIVGRGGGSIEDLWPFNEEIVARAIFESAIPVISAVGHETDWTIADFVADVRAPTPSAAAELVTAEKTAMADHLATCDQRLQQTMHHLFAHYRERLHRFETHPLFTSPYYLLGPSFQRCDELRTDLDRLAQQWLRMKRLNVEAASAQLRRLSPAAQVQSHRRRLQESDRRLTVAAQQRLERAKERLQQLTHHLDSVNPHHLLARGYTILFAEKRRRVVNSISGLGAGQRLEALLADGCAYLTVESVDR
jgi:exodeoxyribonuclease VII large subunit